MIETLRSPAARALVVLSSMSAVGHAQPPVSIELRHRSAEAVITALQPAVAPAALAGAGTHLQVRAEPADLARVTRLIEQADRPLQPLQVSWRDVSPTAEPPVAAGDGSVTLATGRRLPPDGRSNGQVLTTRPAAQPAALLEGDSLLLSMPVLQSLWFGLRGNPAGPKAAAAGKGPSGSTAAAGGKGPGSSTAGAGGIVQFEAPSEFTARIWLAGQTVAIDVQPRLAGRSSASPDPHPDHAVLYGRLGQWIRLSDAGTAPEGAAQAGTWLKVDLAPDAPQ